MKLPHKLSAINEAAARRTIKQFANKYQLVYFGHVDAREDEHQLVRGMTVSTSHVDDHYTVGTFQGRDLILVQRRNRLQFPGKPDADHKWYILQIDLKCDHLPHIFLNAHRHDETFFANLFVKFPQFDDMTAYAVPQDPTFAKHFKVIMHPTEVQQAVELLVPDLTSQLATHFHQFDFEVDDDRLFVYSTVNVITPAILQEMLRAGLWLAEALESVKIPA